MIQNRLSAILLTILILFSMSVGTILTKSSFATITPGIFLYLTLFVAMLSMTVYTFVIKKERLQKELMTAKVWAYIIQIGLFNFVTGTLGIYALNFMPATTNTYLRNFIGFITMGMSVFILKEPPSVFQIIGVVIAFSGLRIFYPETPQAGELFGILLILISISGIAYTNNIARKLSIETDHQLSNTVVSTLAILIGAPIAIVMYLIIEGVPKAMPAPATIGAILYVGLISRAVGLTVWNYILRTLRSYEASILGASTVIWTSLLAVIFLNEEIKQHQMIGIGMMLVGLVFAQIRSSRKGTSTRKKRRFFAFLNKEQPEDE